MPQRQATIHVEPGSELDRLLEIADKADILLEKVGVQYRVNRIATPPSSPVPDPRKQHSPNPKKVLEIIGIGASTEGANIANCKDQYLADAADHRGD